METTPYSAFSAPLPTAAINPLVNAFDTVPPWLKRDDNAEIILTGCLSQLSSCDQPDHDYLDAVKNYAAVYAATQSYLAPLDPLAGHDYAIDLDESEEHNELGLIGGDELKPDVSDEDIDSCGYLGWLRH